jgi:hypothetical protein
MYRTVGLVARSTRPAREPGNAYQGKSYDAWRKTANLANRVVETLNRLLANTGALWIEADDPR